MAQHLANLVEKVGAARLLSGAKDLTDRILPAVVKLAQDSSQEVRYVLKKKKKTFHINSFNFCVLTSLQLIHICLNGEIIFLCIANKKHSAITDNSGRKMSNLRHFKSL